MDHAREKAALLGIVENRIDRISSGDLDAATWCRHASAELLAIAQYYGRIAGQLEEAMFRKWEQRFREAARVSGDGQKTTSRPAGGGL